MLVSVFFLLAFRRCVASFRVVRAYFQCRGLALFGFLFLYSVPIQFCFLDRFLNGLQVHDPFFARVLLIPLVSTVILSHSSLGSARENTLTRETQRKMIMLICCVGTLFVSNTNEVPSRADAAVGSKREPASLDERLQNEIAVHCSPPSSHSKPP